VTGRPSTETSLIFDERDGHWETFRVDPFQRPEQEEFLGPQLSGELLLQPGENEHSHPLKAHWQPLLETPMLLKMMKQLAENGDLGRLTNRERVYQAATSTLIHRGYESHRWTAKLPLNEEQTNRLLSVLAWESIAQDHNFTGVVQGASYERALECLGQTLESRDKVEEALDQINLFTRFSILGHRQRDGIEWRHRSFLEYFAAIHLADVLSADEQTASIAQVHNALAAVKLASRLVACGAWRLLQPRRLALFPPPQAPR
jgi:predicted NACHT family NTPase